MLVSRLNTTTTNIPVVLALIVSANKVATVIKILVYFLLFSVPSYGLTDGIQKQLPPLVFIVSVNKVATD